MTLGAIRCVERRHGRWANRVRVQYLLGTKCRYDGWVRKLGLGMPPLYKVHRIGKGVLERVGQQSDTDKQVHTYRRYLI